MRHDKSKNNQMHSSCKMHFDFENNCEAFDYEVSDDKTDFHVRGVLSAGNL